MRAPGRVAARAGPLAGVFGTPALRTWATVFVAIVVRALPFLALTVGTLERVLAPSEPYDG